MNDETRTYLATYAAFPLSRVKTKEANNQDPVTRRHGDMRAGPGTQMGEEMPELHNDLQSFQAVAKRRRDAEVEYRAACQAYRIEVGHLARGFGNKKAAEMTGVSKSRVSQMLNWPEGLPTKAQRRASYKQAVREYYA